MLVCALAVTPIMFASHAASLWMAVGLVSIAAAAHQGWSANLFTLTSDMLPRRAVGWVVGFGGMARERRGHAHLHRRGRDPAADGKLRAGLLHGRLRPTSGPSPSSRCSPRPSSPPTSGRRGLDEAFPAPDFLLETEVARELYGGGPRPSIVDYHCRPAHQRITPSTTASAPSPRSGWKETTTSGGPCARTAWPSDIAPAMRRRRKSSWRGRRRFPARCGTPLPLDPPGARSGLPESRSSSPRTARAVFEGSTSDSRSPDSRRRDSYSIGVAAVCTTDGPAESLARHKALALATGPRPDLPDLAARQSARSDDPARLQRVAEPAGGGQERRSRLPQFLDALAGVTTPSPRAAAPDHGLRALRRDVEGPRGRSHLRQARAGRARDRGEVLRFAPPSCTASRHGPHGAGCSSTTSARSATTIRGSGGSSARTPASTRSATARWRGHCPVPRPPRRERPAREDHPLQPEPARQRAVRDDDRQLPGRGRPRQDPVRHRLVVPRSEGRWRRRCARSQTGAVRAVRRDGHGLASFLSYSRHEYFRRLLCHILGNDVRQGLLPTTGRSSAASSRTSRSSTPANTSGYPWGRSAEGWSRLLPDPPGPGSVRETATVVRTDGSRWCGQRLGRACLLHSQRRTSPPGPEGGTVVSTFRLLPGGIQTREGFGARSARAGPGDAARPRRGLGDELRRPVVGSPAGGGARPAPRRAGAPDGGLPRHFRGAGTSPPPRPRLRGA